MSNPKLVILASESDKTNIIYNSLATDFQIKTVLIESKSFLSITNFWRNRIKKLGFIHVFGQILFLIIILPFIKFFSKRRIAAIKHNYHLDSSKIDDSKIVHVNSINSDQTLNLIQINNPQVIIINGTNILSDDFLKKIKIPILNIHAGITPAYRGVHGAYWALVQNDLNQCGVTVHFVDSGIDTGKIIAQAMIAPTSEDNFSTYPYLQVGEGITLLKKAMQKIMETDIEITTNSTIVSKCWSHPSLWEYVKYMVLYKVK